MVANVFEWLDVACTLWEPAGWRGIHERPPSLDLLRFELEHGVEAERLTYNKKCLSQALRRKSTVVGEIAGFTDLFVPICSAGGRTEGVLVTGPFATARPTSADVLERWRSLTGNRGHPSDPEFAHYVSTTMSTLVLEGTQPAAFRRLAELCAQLMAGEGSSDAIHTESRTLRRELSTARLAERMWDAAYAMVDERTSRSWASHNRAFQLRQLGVSRFPEQVVVGLFVNRERSTDPLDELIRCDAFQRAFVERAHQVGNVLSGQVGGHGVTLLTAGGSVARTRRHLLDLAEHVSLLGRRRFGFNLHLGVSTRPASLTEQYRVALAAAEAALSKGVRIVQAGDDFAAASPLGPLRKELAKLVEENPAVLPARFDRHLDAVAVRSRYRLDSARAHLEATFELITESFTASGTLDMKSLGALSANLDRAVEEVGTLNDLFAVYRKAVSDIVEAAAAPRVARRDRSLQRAVEYMQRHHGEALSLERVARVAGFATKYFSLAFRKKEGITFERYLIKLRVERARQLLARTALGTPLGLDRVAKLSGFSTANYLCRTFKQNMGETPLGYRERVRKGLDVVPREFTRAKK